MDELISIIVPIYNVANYLRECVDSIINQTYRNLEIILVDDGSFDESPRICDEYSAKDTRIKVVHKSNEGLVAARKTGISMAKGNYVEYVDGDDWIESCMVECLYHAMKEQQVDLVLCGRFENTEDNQKRVLPGIDIGRYTRTDLESKLFPRMITNGDFFEWGMSPAMWDKIYKKEVLYPFQMNVDDRITMGEDAACNYPLMLNVDSLFVMNDCLYHYRQRPGSMIKSVADKDTQKGQFIALFKNVESKIAGAEKCYNLSKQWLSFMLFLMIPRAETLLDGFEDFDYLFPYPNVQKGDEVIIYGMGTYGQRLWDYLVRSGFCKVVMCADRNYEALRRQGIDVVAPDEIARSNCKKIIVANSFYNTRNAIANELSQKYPDKEILTMDLDVVFADDTLVRAGLVGPGIN